MNHNCPNCGKKIKLFSMKMVRIDKLGRKARELGMLYICSHCEETLTRNKHHIELGFSVFIVFVPFYIAIIGFAISSMTVMTLAVILFFTAIGYSYYYYKYRLNDWSRWIKLSDYIENKNKF